MGIENLFFKVGISKNNDAESLSLSSKKMCGSALEEFISTMDDYPFLTELDLSFNAITDQDVYKLVEKLQGKNSPKVRILDLSSNLITDDGVKALATLPLFRLYLSGNHNLTNNCIDFLLQNDSLVHLDLSGNDLISREKKNQIRNMLNRDRDNHACSCLMM